MGSSLHVTLQFRNNCWYNNNFCQDELSPTYTSTWRLPSDLLENELCRVVLISVKVCQVDNRVETRVAERVVEVAKRLNAGLKCGTVLLGCKTGEKTIPQGCSSIK